MIWTRRHFAKLLACPAAIGSAQGIATRNVTPVPRGKSSGLPFRCRFTDVARAAGLAVPVIYGETDHKTYILETVGCGAAFTDYDNDGWLDVLILTGTRMSGAAGRPAACTATTAMGHSPM
jgi:hypothetical protein